MTSKKHTAALNIPTEFSPDVLAALEEFDRRIYFKWDLINDTISLRQPLPNTFYDLSYSAAHCSSQLWLKGFIHPADIHLLHTYLRIINSASPRFHSRHCRLSCKIRLRARNKKDYIWSEVHAVTYFKGSQPVVAFGNIKNIQAQKIHELRVEREAKIDKLTGLLTKDAVKSCAYEYFATLSPDIDQMALILIDADGFKDINDTFGHLFGDGVLAEMGNVLTHTFRRTDIIGRIGGDEFIVLLKNVNNIDHLHERCKSLINNMSRRYKSGNRELSFSVSVGVALYPDHGLTITELFKHADRALYEAKSRGKNCYTFYKHSLIGMASVTNHRSPEDFIELQQKTFKDNMIEFIFMLLYETKSHTATITQSMNMLGMQFKLDRVAVEDYDKATTNYSTVYEWLSPSGISLKAQPDDKAFTAIKNLHNQMVISNYRPTPYGVMSICEDTSLLDDKYKPAAKKLNIGAFAHCLISHGNDTLGCVGFESRHPMKISEEMKKSLSTFTVLLGNILLFNQSAKKAQNDNKQLRALLDHLPEIVYVVDKITMEPVYLNETVRQTLHSVATAEPCYQLFHGRDLPCKNCPVKKLSGEGNEYIKLSIDNWGCGKMSSFACNLLADGISQPLALVVQEASP